MGTRVSKCHASVTDIFGAIFKDPVAKAAGSFIPSDWKRYRDDTWDMEENVEGEQLEDFARYLNSEVLRNKIKFTMKSNGSQLVFLDAKVHLRDDFWFWKSILNRQTHTNT